MKIIFSLSLLLFYTNSFSQNADIRIFNSLCQNILKEEEYDSVKEKLNGISVLVEAVSGVETIKYSDTLDKVTRRYIRKHSTNELIKILSSQPLPLFPLKDTLCIVDSLQFFPDGLTFNGKCFFEVVEHKNKNHNANINYIYLFKIGIRQNNLILAFSLENNSKLFCSYFNLPGNDAKFLKFSVLENEPAVY